MGFSVDERVDRMSGLLCGTYGGDFREQATDLLADVMHWAEAHGAPFHAALKLAARHYRAEVREERSIRASLTPRGADTASGSGQQTKH